MKKELIAHQEPKSPVSEIFRTLRTNIQFMNSNKKLKTLLVTSTLPGEGKSWVSSNLAVTFAQAGKRVVLVDADMRKGRLYSIFGVAQKPGLSNYLSGIDESNEENIDLFKFIRKTPVPNLYLIPAGNIPPNPSELLITSQMVNLIEILKNESDIVIIDGTPSKLVTDAVILSRIVDSTIIVTAHNQTKKEDLKLVVRDIKNVGGHVAGIVYNKIPVSAKKYNETYYYSSVPRKYQNKLRTEIEFELNRQEQINRASEMINFDRKEEKRNKEDNRTVEEKTADVLKEYNEYIQNEKNKNN